MQEVIDAINHCDLKKSSSTVSTEPSDPDGALEESKRILRGGSYLYSAWTARSAFRAGLLPNAYNHYTGFRIVQTFEKEESETN